MLHVVDILTRFQGAVVLKSKSAENVWSALMECCVTLYLGYPYIMRVLHESAITSDSFRRTAVANGITILISGIQSDNSLVAGEPYYAPLRCFLSIQRLRHPTLHPEVSTSASRSSMTPWARVAWLPTLLVFGVLPSLPLSSAEYPNNMERILTL